MRLAIIPARGGSKRIPRKNIKAFAGRPMIAYAIDAAHRAEVFDHVVVSTDDAEIAAVARAAGAEVPFDRPAALADDHTPTVPVVAHAIRSCIDAGWAVDAACCIYPCVPLIRPDDIVAALAILARGDVDYVFPVAAFATPIQRALRRSADGRTSPFDPSHLNTRTQDLEPAYHDAGLFYWGTARAWLDELPIHVNAKTIVLPASRVVDIDTEADWQRAEALVRAFADGEDA